LHLAGIDVDADDFGSMGRLALVTHRIAPAHVGHLQATAHADENVDVVPELASGNTRDTERMVLWHDPAPATERRHGSSEYLGEGCNLRCGMLCTGAAHDQRSLRGCEEPHGLVDRVNIDVRRCERGGRGGDGDGLSRGQVVPAHFYRHMSGTSASRITQRAVYNLRGGAR
jgi:hypothetical protein